jgi:MFS family permease
MKSDPAEMSQEQQPVPAAEPLGKAAMLGLGAMAWAVLVIANDFTALSVALPAIEADFDADVTTVQWVISGYALVFGVLIVSGGRLADMFGRRRIFFLGSIIFALFSVLGGLATDAWMLLGARGVMGIGGALMWPAILGMTYDLTPSGKAGLAGGLILGAAGFGNAVGPLLGGALTDALSWRWIFFLNLPIAAFAVFVTWRVVPAEKLDRTDRRIDYGGVVALSIGLFALLLSLDLGVDLGSTNPRIIALFAASVLSLAAFALIERRAGENALVPSDVRGNRAFLAAGIATLLMSAIFFAALLYLPQFMTKELGYSAVKAGAGLLPMMGTFALTSFIAGPLYARLGAKVICTTGGPVPGRGDAFAVPDAAGDDLRGVGPGDGRARYRGRALLLVDHDRGDHRPRSVAGKPGRRDRLHVPDRRWGDRPRTEHRTGRHGVLAHGRDPDRVPGRRGPCRLRPGGVDSVRRWPDPKAAAGLFDPPPSRPRLRHLPAPGRAIGGALAAARNRLGRARGPGSACRAPCSRRRDPRPSTRHA